MEEAVKIVQSMCSEYNLQNVTKSLYNKTIYPDPVVQLPSVLCERSRIIAVHRQQNLSAYFFHIDLTATILGLLNIILSLAVFSHREFRTVSFFYHKVINAIEIVHVFSDSVFAAKEAPGSQVSNTPIYVHFLVYFNGKIEFGFDMWIELMLVWISVERACLCLFPVHFQRINEKKIAYMVIAVTGMLGLAVYIPLFFSVYYVWNPGTNLYELHLAENFDWDIFDMWLSFVQPTVGALLLLGTLMTVYGLAQASIRKRGLISKNATLSESSKILLHEIKVNQQLCILQVCETVPVVLNYSLQLYINHIEYTPDVNELIKMSYENAMKNLYIFDYATYLFLIQHVWAGVSHCTHFIRYYIFCAKLRRVFKSMLKRKGATTSVTPARAWK